MNRRIVICDRRDQLVATLETILRHWGYRVLATNDPLRGIEYVDIHPDLLLVGSDLLHDSEPLRRAVTSFTAAKGNPVIPIAHPDLDPPPGFPDEVLHVPFNLFELFAYVQKYLEKIPRRNLRLNISLPGMISLGAKDYLADVLSLSSHGLFVKTSVRVEPGQTFVMLLPLLGLKEEVEVPCRTLYAILPTQENNYLQGFGVEFVDPTPATLASIRKYLEQNLLAEIARRSSPHDHVEVDHIDSHTCRERLRLIVRDAL